MPPRRRRAAAPSPPATSTDDETYAPSGATPSEPDEDDTSGDSGEVYLPTRAGGLRRRSSTDAAGAADVLPPPRVAATPLGAALTAACSPRTRPEDPPPATPPQAPAVHPLALLRARESAAAFRAAQRAFLASGAAFAPSAPAALVDRLPSRAYVGHFSDSGALFVAAFQGDRRVKLYDSSRPTARHWPCVKSVDASRGLRWTMTEVAVSGDDRALAYSTIAPRVHVVPLGGSSAARSITNVTEVHAGVDLDRVDGTHPDARLPPFGVWCLRWQPGTSSSARRLLAGTGGGGGDGHVVLADVERGVTVARGLAAGDDVNAVAFLDATGTTFASGADDADVKVWDARTLPLGDDDASAARARPVATLAGHLAGVTYLDARGDGVTLLSNAKDQTAKLWDVRSPGRRSKTRAPVPHVEFDYRWNRWPRAAAGITHPADASLATFRGHSVLVTLIRARLSPRAAGGGAHIYAGSADGIVRVWDAVTGDVARELAFHQDVVRDVSWCPTAPGVLVSSSFDGSIVRWGPAGEADEGSVERMHTGNLRDVWF